MTQIAWQSITAEDFLEVLLIAANARTDEEKARVAWRASDYLWAHIDKYPIGFCRKFNDYCGDQNWPRVKNLWSKEEKLQMQQELLDGLSKGK